MLIWVRSRFSVFTDTTYFVRLKPVMNVVLYCKKSSTTLEEHLKILKEKNNYNHQPRIKRNSK